MSQMVSGRKNPPFGQFTEANIDVVRALVQSNPVAAEIFLFLIQYMNKKNAVVCSSKVLEEITNKSRPTISRAISVLKNSSFVNVMKSGQTNVYILNPHVVWKTWRDEKSFCALEGSILLSKSENIHIDEIVNKVNPKIEINN
ncbi:Firmicute plasmid replication protein [Candidatus Regiella insecticola 5.15]|uniref:Firmicute plasmid replication protein n=1 Tax=Candidatus Regiella insecticola 5.15 TaxID=1005043 RepID=G2GXF1_9ENTR|nr:helix-turn-helix domain-containing protein [Candidatus Regiella insecticola]EGY29584.1 Firmicute plasmid replication protein [Candidatus Regiella insecticola 5.15]